MFINLGKTSVCGGGGGGADGLVSGKHINGSYSITVTFSSRLLPQEVRATSSRSIKPTGCTVCNLVHPCRAPLNGSSLLHNREVLGDPWGLRKNRRFDGQWKRLTDFRLWRWSIYFMTLRLLSWHFVKSATRNILHKCNSFWKKLQVAEI